MKQHAHRPRRTLHIAGEAVGLAEIALGVACGITLAVTMWVWVVLMVALFG